MVGVKLLVVLVVLFMCSLEFTVAEAQQCTVPATSPRDSTEVTPSAPDTFLLYSNPFNSSKCTGVVIAYDFCYQFQRTTGQRPVVFTVLILEDNGGSYTIVQQDSFREQRGCSTTIVGGIQRCCQRINLAESLVVDESFTYGILTPAGGNNRLLAVDGTADGYEIPAAVYQQSVTGNLLSKVDLGIGDTINRVQERSFQLIVEPQIIQSSTSTAAVRSPTPIPESGSSSSSSGGDPGAIVTGVVVSLVVVAALVSAIVVVAVLFVRRRRKTREGQGNQKKETNARKYQSTKSSRSTLEYINTLYTATDGTELGSVRRSDGNNGYHYDMSSYEEMGMEQHDYAVPSDMGDVSPVQDWEEYVMPQALTVQPTGQGLIDPYGDLETGSTRTSSTISTARQNSLVSTYADPDNIYMVPANEESALYAQYRKMEIHHIARDSVSQGYVLGSGEYGTVKWGEWQSPNGPVEVAVKSLNGGPSIEKVKFLQEAAIMGQFSHPNIVKLHGVIIEGDPKMIVLELLPKGDLRTYLQGLHHSGGERVNSSDEDLPHTLLSYCRQIASGMSYLAGKAFIHRDLAARNVLLAEDGACKIADFGMSRDLMDESFYVAHGGIIPVKWTSPEALHFRKYSTASDVWSCGVVVYEIWSLGQKPFAGYTNGQAISMVDSGVRLPPPPGCPKPIYDLMIKCWHPSALRRPNFLSVVQCLSQSDKTLLKWSERDRADHPQACELGADLQAGVDLHKDLQSTYLIGE